MRVLSLPTSDIARYVVAASPEAVAGKTIIDTTTVVFIRIKERRPIYVGDTRHLSHRLLSLGFSQRASVLFIYLATLCFGLGAIGLADASLQLTVVIML